jgi:HAD superfamily hydrolase (TIGR01509 family)
MPVSLVIFDLDGVLIDSRDNMAAAWAHARETFALKPTFEDYFAVIGAPFTDILTTLGITEQHEGITQAFASASKGNAHLIRKYEGVDAMLETLHHGGYRRAIVTSKDAERTRLFVDRFGISVEAVQAPAPGLRGKPHPDQLLAVADRLERDPADAVYIGDMAPDRLAAAAAGMGYIHAAWGYGGAQPGDTVCQSVAELAATVRSLDH